MPIKANPGSGGIMKFCAKVGVPGVLCLPETASRTVAITTRAQTFPEQQVSTCLPPFFIHIQLRWLTQREGSLFDIRDDDGHFYSLCQHVEP